VLSQVCRYFLFSLSSIAPVDDHVVLIGHAVDPDAAEGEILEAQWHLPA
jgi:hypothetical protein